MLPWKQRKRHILPVDQNLSSVYFSFAKFQLLSCNLSLAMIWQMTYTHKLPNLCSATLSNNDGDGYENVSWKMNSGCFKLYRAYSVSFSSSNVGRFFWSWILKDCIEVQKKKRKVVVLCSLQSPQNVELRQRNVQKSVMHVQSCYFVNLNLLIFFRPRWRRRRRCLSSRSL